MFFGKRFSGHRSKHLSGLEILVLSMIKSNSGITGYEIIQNINQKFKGLWKASAGTIYPLIERLNEHGYVNAEETIEANLNKNLLYITEKGKEELELVLKGNLEPSLSALGDYVRTLLKGFPENSELEEMMMCFPFCGPIHGHKINPNDISLKNKEHIEKLIIHLRSRKASMEHRLKAINKRIDNLEKIKDSSYDLVFCDIHMPRKNGFDTFMAAREIDPGLNFIMTDSFPDKLAEKTNQMGALSKNIRTIF
ncbi:MAG: helix-turn-helix transcriptional regulator [Candidatus Lokiarchaeota archaeon]